MSILWLDAAESGYCVYVFTVWVCGLVERALCVCGNYCNLNAGSAGETGCLLINEWSRWPRVGGSCERTASWSGGQHNTDTWAITNKTSPEVYTSQRHQACVCVYLGVCVWMAFLKVYLYIHTVISDIRWPLEKEQYNPSSYVVYVLVVKWTSMFFYTRLHRLLQWHKVTLCVCGLFILCLCVSVPKYRLCVYIILRSEPNFPL